MNFIFKAIALQHFCLFFLLLEKKCSGTLSKLFQQINQLENDKKELLVQVSTLETSNEENDDKKEIERLVEANKQLESEKAKLEDEVVSLRTQKVV